MADEAVKVAKSLRDQLKEDGARVLSTGVRAYLKSVPQSVIQDALALLPEPKVPMWHNPEKDRDEPNPVDPDYLADMEAYRSEQFRVTFDVFAMFGVELVDSLPESGDWLKQLRLMERLGRLDLSKFDLEDSVDQEFLYKRYIALGNADYVLVGALSGISPQEVRRAADSFRGDAPRGEDRAVSAEEHGQHGDTV
jgi:hypothetical protein